jgi:hypothetical protein
MKLEFCPHISNKKPDKISRKSVQWEPSVSTWTDGQTDKTNPIVVLRTGLKAGKGVQEMIGGTVNGNMLPCICMYVLDDINT